MTFTNEENKTPDLFITKHVESADDRYEVPVSYTHLDVYKRQS